MAELAVIIPTLGRPEKLKPLAENLAETTTTPYRLYLVMEFDDMESIEAFADVDSSGVIGDYGSCAKAVNAGYHASTEPLFAVANDDVVFHHGWDTAAIAALTDEHHIIGLNDGSGDCKCFTLARRSYIEAESGVFDRPNTVYHEGYTSQCVDTELAFYAQLRGSWGEAPDALLEHIHWRFGKADANHPNYIKARETNAADLEEYARRRDQWDPQGVTPMAVPGA